MSQFFESGGQSVGVAASASVLPMNSVLISFRIDWFDFLAVQGTLKSLLQHHNSKVSVLWCSAFFVVQLSHSYTITGKTIALTIQTFVSKEIKPVNPKGNQPWIFIGRTDAEAEAPTLWPPDVKSQLIRKDPDAEKDWGQEEKRATEDEMVGWRH